MEVEKKKMEDLLIILVSVILRRESYFHANDYYIYYSRYEYYFVYEQ